MLSPLYPFICIFYTASKFSPVLQAGTQFWDEKLENELAEGRLSGTAFDRYVPLLKINMSHLVCSMV